jgi:hypothetical protein
MKQTDKDVEAFILMALEEGPKRLESMVNTIIRLHPALGSARSWLELEVHRALPRLKRAGKVTNDKPRSPTWVRA